MRDEVTPLVRVFMPFDLSSIRAFIEVVKREVLLHGLKAPPSTLKHPVRAYIHPTLGMLPGVRSVVSILLPLPTGAVASRNLIEVAQLGGLQVQRSIVGIELLRDVLTVLKGDKKV